MNFTPADDSAKRSRVKVVVKAPAAEKPPRKTLTATRKKTLAAAVIIQSAPQPAVDLHGEIAKTAFYLAAERNFVPGHEFDDWLEAERRIKSRKFG
jgi:hypothetical protein